MNKIHSVHNIPFAAPPPRIYFKFNPQKYNSIFKFSLPALLTKPLYVSGHTNFMR